MFLPKIDGNVTYASRRLSSWALRGGLTGTLRATGSLRDTSGVDSWTRVDIGADLLVDVDENAGISVLVSTREQNSAWGRSTTAGDSDLVARGIELCLVQ